MHDAVTDLVVSIFAPKNFLEMARVLRCGGWLALVYPGPEHLIELRDRFGLLRQDEENPARYADTATRFVVLCPSLGFAAVRFSIRRRHTP